MLLSKHFSFLLSASALALTAVPALAQEGGDKENPDLAANDDTSVDIVVTAERREDTLLKTPISLSVFTSQERDILGIIDSEDIADFTPGLNFQNSPNRLSIRGIGRLDNALGTDPGIATYVDGVFVSDTQSLDRAPLFIERIEVLRGPQGTLFGRNSVGGLVNIITKRPEFTSEQEARFRVGSFGTLTGQFTTTGSLFGSDNTAYRLNLSGILQLDGRYDNTFSGVPDLARDNEEYAIELQISHSFSDNLDLWLRYRTEHTNGRSVPSRRTEPYDFRGPGAPPLTYFGALQPNPLFGLDETNPAVDDPLTQRLDFSGRQSLNDVHEVVGELTWDVGPALIRYIGSYQTRDFDFAVDADGTARASHTLSPLDPSIQDPLGTVTSTFSVNDILDTNETTSHEIQFLSNDDSNLRWIAGLYYYHENSLQDFGISSPQAVAAGTPQLFDFANTTGACLFGFAPDFICGLGGVAGDANPDNNTYFQTGDLTVDSYAAYGQIDWEFVPGLTLKAGLRYTRDEKEGFEAQQIYAYNPFGAFGAGTGVAAPIPWIQLTPNNNERTLENSWDAVTGIIGLNYEWDANSVLYAQYSRGYKAGGMRLGLLPPDDPTTPEDERFVDEETVDAFEIGAKTLAANGRLRLAASAFYYDYKNLQAPIDFVNQGGIVQPLIVNVPESRTFGFEFEMFWLITDNFSLGGNYSFLDTEVTSFPTLVANPPLGIVQSLEGNTLPRSPRHSGNVNARYTFDLVGGSDLTIIGNWTFTDDLHNTLFDDPIYTIEANDRFGLRALWNNANGDVTIIAAIDNFFDNNAPNSVTVSTPDAGFSRLEDFVNQRTFFVEIQKRF